MRFGSGPFSLFIRPAAGTHSSRKTGASRSSATYRFGLSMPRAFARSKTGDARAARLRRVSWDVSPGGEIGRRKGLKILFRASGVRVQVPPRAPDSGVSGPETQVMIVPRRAPVRLFLAEKPSCLGGCIQRFGSHLDTALLRDGDTLLIWIARAADDPSPFVGSRFRATANHFALR
jgi:hypothetical protein